MTSSGVLMSENEINSPDNSRKKKKTDDIESFMKTYYECFQPILGLCSISDRPVITYIFDNMQFTRFLERKDFQHLIIKCLLHYGHAGEHVFQLSEKVINILISEAISSGKKLKLERRIGNHNGSIYINMGNSKGEFVGLTPNGWNVCNRSPVHFLSSPKDLSLPDPVDCELKEFLHLWKSLFNFKDDNSSYLALGFAVKAMLPNTGANPILVLEGVQGSGKTTVSVTLKKLIDPTLPAIFSPPKTEKDFLIMANTTHLPVIDNSSGFSAEMSDVLCRASTGGGISLRVLYETDEERVYNFCKPIIVNGIEELTDRADFVERALILYLKPLGFESRISETQYWNNFELVYPKLMGGLLKLLVHVLKVLPNIQTNRLVRMTEYNRVGLALDKAFNFEENYFSEVLQQHQDQKLSSIFDNDMFCQLIHETLERNGDIEGSATQLMKKIYRNKGEKVPNHILPRDPRRFKGKLQRLKTVLEANGIEWGEIARTSDSRGLFIRLMDESQNNIE